MLRTARGAMMSGKQRCAAGNLALVGVTRSRARASGRIGTGNPNS